MIKKLLRNKIRILCAFSWVIFFLSFGIRTYFSNRLVSNSLQLADLYSQKSQLEKDVSRTTFEISELSSLKNIEERARILGFVSQYNPVASIDPYSSAPLAALSSQ